MIDSYQILDDFPQNYEAAKDYWEIAKGLQAVDNLQTSKYLDSLIIDNLNGTKTYKEVEDDVKNYYIENEDSNSDEKQADLSAIRIAMLLDNPDFRLLKSELLRFHAFIFENAFPDELIEYIGKFRDVNIKKSEDILCGKSVRYSDYTLIDEYLDFDLENERNRLHYEKIDNIEHLAKFISNIWNVHPFREGNTRTIAAFILKYLKHHGFNVDNELFKNNSKYFRDSLVLASDNELNIEADYSYLESFLTKLLVDKNYELKSMETVKINNKNLAMRKDIDDMSKGTYDSHASKDNKNNKILK